ncbi:hypothetical protein CC86DRAFT_430475 [Ophiobolus disseminans]|uniref:Uncharacterized protein n=1 Tax=Ophiobolus disseminans TaxID=1469910 RepID=A0A6A6ZEW4_9PLEO|nr:hypothetical protein CC86DRAFT_430475 [Ophiobolus disseminans]
MDTIIDNLSTHNVTAFKDIEPKILDVADKHSLVSTDLTAYAARQAAARSNRGPRPTQTQPRPTAGTPGPQECTWCWKHDLTFVGHVYTNCRQLRQHKEQQAKDKDSKGKDGKGKDGKGKDGKGKDGKGKDGKGKDGQDKGKRGQPQQLRGSAKQHKGNSVDADSDWDSDNNITEVHAFSAAAPTTINLTDNGSGNWFPDHPRTSANQNGKPSRKNAVPTISTWSTNKAEQPYGLGIKTAS